MKYLEKHPMVMIVVGVIGIALSSIFVRYSSAPSVVTAAWRLLWTVALLSPMVIGKKEVRQEFAKVDRKTAILSIVSGLFLAVHFSLWFESLRHTTVASSTVICCTEVIWVSIGYCLFLKGKMSWKAAIAIGTALIGSVLIALSDASGGGSHLYGDVLSLLSAVAVALYVLIGRVVRKDTSTTVYTFMVYGACGGALLMTCFVQGCGLLSYGGSAVIVGLLLAVFSTILGHSIFTWCLKYFSPSFVSASKLCEPVVAAMLAGLLFDEIPTLMQLGGGALILGGVLYYSRLEAKQE